MKILPRAEQICRAFVVSGLLSIAASCNDNEQPSFQSAVQFSKSELSFSEKGSTQSIPLLLSIPASSDCEIVLTVTAPNIACFVTEPATEKGQVRIHVSKGHALIDFSITPVDNDALDGNKMIRIAITSLSKGLQTGSVSDLNVSINDDESPSIAGFADPGMKVRENDPVGALITVDFETPTPADGVLVFAFNSQSKYGQDYITEPAAIGDKIFVQVAKGSTSSSIRLLPVNDNSFTADRNINIELYDAIGGLQIGTNDSFWLTITEDDGQQISSVAQIRSMAGPDAVTLHNNYIEGIITSIDNVSGGRVVIEDVTGALQLQLAPGHDLTRGDVVLVNLDQGLLHLQQGVLEVRDVASFQKLGEETLQVSKLSLDELLQSTDRIQSQTIQLTGVSFKQANGQATFLGDRIVSDGTNSIIVRTISLADFSNELIPPGILNVTGIFVKVDGQNYLYPQALTDVRKAGQLGIRPTL